MARSKPIAEQFAIARQETVEATHKLLVDTAKSEHARVMSAAPRPSDFDRFVDSVAGAPEEAVKPFGVIHYVYQRLPEVVLFALDQLRAFSPVLTGEYRNAHTIFVNGEPVADLSGWKREDRVAISNPLPYTRKIELGSMTMRVPGTSHVYEQAVSATNRRYGNVAKALFTWQSLTNDRRSKSENRHPAIVFKEL